jgi:acetylornithine deacetylase/succinyl-diaminopimelate desuccinylase-like protein
MADLSLGMPEHTPREETLLELARQLFPAQVRPVLPRIRFGIADTNVILKNIGRDVRDWPRPTRMRILTETGAIRFYVGRHIVEEVEEKIDAWMTARRMDKAVARRIWMEEYLPSLWVVDMGSMHMDDDRVSVLALRDPDDLPTAQLAVLLGQKALSEDKDLAANGLATGEPWLTMHSGAAHDTMCVADYVPSAMVFVPCKDGISHHPAEDASPADAALAAEIILNAIQALED